MEKSTKKSDKVKVKIKWKTLKLFLDNILLLEKQQIYWWYFIFGFLFFDAFLELNRILPCQFKQAIFHTIFLSHVRIIKCCILAANDKIQVKQSERKGNKRNNYCTCPLKRTKKRRKFEISHKTQKSFACIRKLKFIIMYIQ